MARRKSTVLNAPTTIEEATALLAEYATTAAAIEEARAEADSAIAAIEGARDMLCKPHEERLKDMFNQLRAWWAVAGDHVTNGKRKSTEIAGCVLGIRTTTPALKLPSKITSEDLIAQLIEWDQGDEFLTTTVKLNKPAIISTLRGTDGYAKTELAETYGFTVTQKDEFFIDRVKRDQPADPDVVPAEEAAA